MRPKPAAVFIKYDEELQLKEKTTIFTGKLNRIFSLRGYQVNILLKNGIPRGPKELSDRRFHQLQVRPGSNPQPLQLARRIYRCKNTSLRSSPEDPILFLSPRSRIRHLSTSDPKDTSPASQLTKASRTPAILWRILLLPSRRQRNGVSRNISSPESQAHKHQRWRRLA
jgi:hypothetical protein